MVPPRQALAEARNNRGQLHEDLGDSPEAYEPRFYFTGLTASSASWPLLFDVLHQSGRRATRETGVSAVHCADLMPALAE